MPPNTSKQMSPAELAKLEHAFASDPSSDAYRPLAEAYLGMGRFMEAMVVCKKGVKAHPTVPFPRLLLSRVYAEQGKDKKALEEALAALQVAPADKIALRTTGALQLKTGEADAGKANLLKAFAADPGDSDTLAAMQQHKVEAPRKDPPPPPPAPVQVAPVQQAPAAGTNGASVHVDPGIVQGRPLPAQPGQQQQRPAVAQPGKAPAKPGARPQPQQNWRSDTGEISEVSEVSRRGNKGGASRTIFVVLAVLVPLLVGGYFGIGVWKAKRNRQVNSFLSQMRDLVRHDSFDGYQKAAKLGEEALDLDPGRKEVHAYLAMIQAIRSGEHGGGEEARKSAEQHISEVRNVTDSRDGLYQRIAAEAYLKFYGGKRAEAAKELEAKLQEIDPDGKASLLWLTLGIILTDVGDLEGAREALEKAQHVATTDARVYAALGNVNHRRGNDGEALRNFDSALKYERGHPDSMLGTALLILDQDNPALGYGQAAKSIKALIDAQPVNSPRQEALALMGRSLLYARVTTDGPLYKDPEFRKKLEADTGIVLAERDKNRDIIKKSEDEAFSRDRTNPELLLLKGKKLLYEGNLPGAVDEIRKAIAADSTRAHYHVELGKALMLKPGGEKEAEEALRKALTLVPDSPKLLTLLGTVLYKEKRVDEAIAVFERAVKDKARNAEARYSLGRLYRDEKKDLPKAIENLEAAARDYVGNSMMVAQSYDEVANTLDARGDKTKAREYFERSNNADRDYDPAACHYARWLIKGGDGSKDKEKDKEKVKELAKRYLDLNPSGECAAELKPLAQ